MHRVRGRAPRFAHSLPSARVPFLQVAVLPIFFLTKKVSYVLDEVFRQHTKLYNQSVFYSRTAVPSLRQPCFRTVLCSSCCIHFTVCLGEDFPSVRSELPRYMCLKRRGIPLHGSTEPLSMASRLSPLLDPCRSCCVLPATVQRGLYNSAPVPPTPACLSWIHACIHRTPHDRRGQGLCSVWHLPCLLTTCFQELMALSYSPLALPPRVLVPGRGSSGGGARRAGPPALLPRSGFVFAVPVGCVPMA